MKLEVEPGDIVASSIGVPVVCSIHRRQTCRRGGAQNLLPLPRACQSSRLCLHPLRTLIPRTKSLICRVVRGGTCSKHWELLGTYFSAQLTSFRETSSPHLDMWGFTLLTPSREEVIPYDIQCTHCWRA